MNKGWWAACALAPWWWGPVPAAAQLPARGEVHEPTGSLSREEVLLRAKQSAPLVLAAAAQVDEARGRLLAASVWLRDNPAVEAAAGRRDGSQPAAELRLGQPFELGGKRGARIDAAQAGVERAGAAAADALRGLLRDAALVFARALYGEQRVALALGAQDVAEQVAHIAERRLRAADVAILDVNLARAALARARSEREAAEAARLAALGELRALLGMDAGEALAVRGELHARVPLETPELLQRAAQRPDLLELEAQAREADAELALGRGMRFPDVEAGMEWEREDDERTVRGGLRWTLPIFQRGQGMRAEAGARARRLRLQLAAARRRAQLEVHTAAQVYARRVAALQELETNALPLLDENERLARRSYEVGQLGLGEYLALRRELNDLRAQHLERQLEAAGAAAELEASAGVLP